MVVFKCSTQNVKANFPEMYFLLESQIKHQLCFYPGKKKYARQKLNNTREQFSPTVLSNKSR